MAGAAGLAGASAFAVLRSLTPPLALPREVMETFVYVEPVRADLPVWYVEQGLVGKEARRSHFVPGRGANCLWRVEMDERGQIVPNTGFPALLLEMDEAILDFPSGYARSEFVHQGLYALFNCCPRACCRPEWQLIPRSKYLYDLGYDNVVCPCHFEQYNPRIITEYRHPAPPEASGATYIGIHMEAGTGPVERGMPLIPIELTGDRVVGTLRYPDWYRYLLYKDRIFA